MKPKMLQNLLKFADNWKKDVSFVKLSSLAIAAAAAGVIRPAQLLLVVPRGQASQQEGAKVQLATTSGSTLTKHSS